ncbi:MAG: hypothetical protein WCQ95_07440 [Bacteroidota bacterium]
MKNYLFVVLFTCVVLPAAWSQHPSKHKGRAIEKKQSRIFTHQVKWEKVSEGILHTHQADTIVFRAMQGPTDTALYKKIWFNTPALHQNSEYSWAYGAVGMLESDIYRQHGQKVKLSPMFVVYYDYLLRIQDFVKTKGNTNLDVASEPNALLNVMGTYGIAPLEAYNGLEAKPPLFDSGGMLAALKDFLLTMKNNNNWDMEQVMAVSKDIMNQCMGQPPDSFVYENISYTPQSFLTEYIKIIPNDYYSFMSVATEKFNQKGELLEPDNWWHSKNYYNVCVIDFLKVAADAISAGYPVCINGDFRCANQDTVSRVLAVSQREMPAQYINDSWRGQRWSFVTTNANAYGNHCAQIVGYYLLENKYWFLINDQQTKSNPSGLWFMSQDFLKFKISSILLYKYGAKQVLDKIIK